MAEDPIADSRAVLIRAASDFRANWKSLAVTGAAFKIIAFIVLTPLVGVLFRTLIALSGSSILTDVDIAYLFLRPVGLACVIVTGACWLGIIALEQTALLGILCASELDRRLSFVGALRFAAANAWKVVQLTGRVLVWLLLVLLPFAVVAGVTYVTLLSNYDINYYLTEKPPVFIAAVCVGGMLLAVLGAILLRAFTGWLFALPLLLFENVSPSQSLRQSNERATGHRRTIVLFIVGWIIATSGMALIATGVVAAVGNLLVQDGTASLRYLMVTVGLTLSVWAFANVTINLLTTTTFAAILFNLYRYRGSGNLSAVSLGQAISSTNQTGLGITRTRLIMAGVVGVVVAATVGAFAIQSVRLEDDVEVMAHRGASAVAPENTMAAFERAIEDGADWIELDVQETSDGEVVVLHDSDFMKLGGNPLKIWDATIDDLSDIDIGSRIATEFASERTPLLSDVLRACKGRIGVNIELKYYGHDQDLEQRVVDVVEAEGMVSDVLAMSLKRDGVRKLKSLRPDWKVGLLMSVSAGDLRKIDVDFLAVNAGFASRSFIASAHASGMDVYVWTVNDPVTMSTMIGRGVDGLLTDRPALARKVLKQRAAMSAPERLMLELAGLLRTDPPIAEQ
ncbi:glycerophosphoryl diester phosphodiesterase [Rhodopirellula rubra]|uniref:Glycerophosphoryl diester phosphodiesterase n=1 Tax=Aporhodopirellula rubra TaxID=980271 RepID=A0A7W5H8V2_9BACT|nr:glycerophosphodiester phosphodiesterase family protein [Aporhodopirellula rubra]MBB3209470.1 glycerophosphoryl diester phosphodiesterase [Aporhodopirellula rubra]